MVAKSSNQAAEVHETWQIAFPWLNHTKTSLPKHFPEKITFSFRLS